MLRFFFLLLATVTLFSCNNGKYLIQQNVEVRIYPSQDSTGSISTIQPEIKPSSSLYSFYRRFDYLLLNVPKIHQEDQNEKRSELWLQNKCDTNQLIKSYMESYKRDRKLNRYFKTTTTYVAQSAKKEPPTYTIVELMEVASKFFYCHNVLADTTIQAHVCVGLNGVEEAKWKRDYTLLEAFCYEAIFNDFDKEHSEIWNSFVAKKKEASLIHKPHITSLDLYLYIVKIDLFTRMKNDPILQRVLLDYYQENKNNLSFKVSKTEDKFISKH